MLDVSDDIDALRIHLLDERERQNVGPLRAFRNRFTRKFQALLGKKQENRMQTFDMSRIEELCSPDEIQIFQKRLDESQEKAGPYWVSVPTFFIDASGKADMHITRIPSQQNGINRLIDFKNESGQAPKIRIFNPDRSAIMEQD